MKSAYNQLFPLLLLIIIPTTINWSGLFGPFLLDDFGNLGNLEKYNTIAGYTWYNLLSDAQAGGSGRPIALLSFLSTAFAWPDNPLPFKAVNLILHIINTLLVYTLSFRICKVLGNTDRLTIIVSFATALIWATHPIQQSTVFYVIQRMTQLSALFLLLGTNYYIYHRSKYNLANIKNYFSLSVIYSSCLVLAVLSKENGLLLCLFVLLIEGFLFSKSKDQWLSWLRWGGIFSLLPFLLFVLYIVGIWDIINTGYLWRDFDLYERVLTQFNVISSYIGFIIIPTLSDSTLFHDDFNISRTLFEWPTFASFLFITSLLVAAFLLRKKKPIVSFGIAWFFTGHIMESTFLPLELYFEHRNYLPSFGIIFTLVYMATHIPENVKRISYLLIIIYLLMISWLSYINASIWGDEDKLINIWAKERIYSVRANQNQAIYWHRLNNGAMVYKTLHEAGKLLPMELGIRMQELQYACDLDIIDNNLTEEIINISSTGKYGHEVTQTLMQIITLHTAGKCKSLKFDQLLQIASGIKANPRFKSSANQSNIDYVIGILYASKGDLNKSIKQMDMAFSNYNDPNIAILQAGWLASAGLYEDALTYLNKAETAIDNLKAFKNKDYSEVRKFRKQILEDMKASPDKNKP